MTSRRERTLCDGIPRKPVSWHGIAPPLKQSSSPKLHMPKDTEGFQSLEAYFNKIQNSKLEHGSSSQRENSRLLGEIGWNWVLKINLLFTCILSGQDGSFWLSFQSSNLWWFPELQKSYTDLLRSPGKPSLGVLWCLMTPWLLYTWLSIGFLLQLETSDYRCSFFCWKRRNLPSLLRSYTDPEGSSQKAAHGCPSLRLFSRMYSMQWPENKAIKLPYPSVITRKDEI